VETAKKNSSKWYPFREEMWAAIPERWLVDFHPVPLIILPNLSKGRQSGKELLVEDSADRILWFKTNVPGIEVASTVASGIKKVQSKKYQRIWLDYNLEWPILPKDKRGQEGRRRTKAEMEAIAKLWDDIKTGFNVAEVIVKSINKDTDIVVHSNDSEGAKEIQRILPQAIIASFGTFEIQ